MDWSGLGIAFVRVTAYGNGWARARLAAVIELVSWDVVFPVRHEVLRPGRPPETARFDQDEHPDTFHLAARDRAGAVIGCATFFPEPLDGRPAWRLRGMATVSAARGKGIGGQVLAAGGAEIRRRGGTIVWCQGRLAAADFYRGHGFVSRGDQFLIEPGGPHSLFVRRI